MNQDFKTPRRMSLAKGRRVSTISNPRSIHSRNQHDKRPDTKMSDIQFIPNSKEKLVTITLAYSTSVEKAFKRQYKSTFFGPPSGYGRKGELLLDVENLPELYSDFVYINDLLIRNQRFARKLLEENAESGEEPGKLLKLPKVNRSRKHSTNSRASGRPTSPTLTKLPAISSSNSNVTVSSNGGRPGTSDNAVQVG